MIRIEETGNVRRIFHDDEKTTTALIEEIGGQFRWTNLRGLDTNGQRLHHPPALSSGTSPTLRKAFFALGYQVKEKKSGRPRKENPPVS